MGDFLEKWVDMQEKRAQVCGRKKMGYMSLKEYMTRGKL